MRFPRVFTLTVPLILQTAMAFAQGPAYEVVNSYPHDTGAFTEGLVLVEGVLYEGTGLYGASNLREVTLETGAVVRQVDLSSAYFGEGITLFQGKIFQLTYLEQVGFIYDPATFTQIGQFSYVGEGWGLTHDDQHLIMSDGTNQIRFLDPVTLNTVRTILVYSNGNPVANLNELEYINGKIYANVWPTNWVVRIDPISGAVTDWIDFSALVPAGFAIDVLNGIAYDERTGHLLMTGKWWPTMYEIRVLGNSAPVAQNQSVTTSEDASANIALGAADADGDPLTFAIVGTPAHGSLSGIPPYVTYTPASNYNGTDSFTFKANDGTHDSNVATVSLAVASVNDAPVAWNDSYATGPNTVLAVGAPGVLANDSDVDGSSLTAVLVTPPVQGSVTFNANGSFTYTPAPNFTGTDSFSYAASDGINTSGTALVTLLVQGPTLTVSPTSVNFGNQAVGTTSSPFAVTVSNPGSAVLTIAAIAITGAHPGDFAYSSACGASVAPGATCAISVTFRPTTTGSRKGALTITSNAAGSPHVVQLGGSGKKGRGR
jgi:glutaminyl-peptide cyclotransferase